MSQKASRKLPAQPAPSGSRPLLVAGLAAALLAGVGMQTAPAQGIALPELGDSASSMISPEQEKKIGAQVMRQIRRVAPLIKDQELAAYIDELGDSIARYTDYNGDFTFFLLDLTEINAFALPGGYIGFHSGLILNSQDENEVASVMAHEIVHVTQRHSIRNLEAQQNMSIPGIVAMIGAIALAAVAPQAGQAALAGVQAMQVQSILNFTRSNEQEADRIGIGLLHQAGYEPAAMARFFQRLRTANRYNDPKHIPEYLRTHPVTTNRIAEARARAANLSPNPHESSLAYHLAWAKLMARSYAEPLRAVEYFEATIASDSARHPEAAMYGYAIALSRAGNRKQADRIIRELIAARPDHIYYHTTAAEFAMDRKDFAEARRHYEDALALSDRNRAAVYGMADLFTKTGKADLARTLLRDFSFRAEPDLDYFRLLAYAEGEAGDVVGARITIAEYYFRAGELSLAREQLRLAQEDPQAASYQRLKIEARIEEVEKALAEEEEGL